MEDGASSDCGGGGAGMKRKRAEGVDSQASIVGDEVERIPA